MKTGVATSHFHSVFREHNEFSSTGSSKKVPEKDQGVFTFVTSFHFWWFQVTLERVD
jgi:hypothetical protein